MGKANFWKVSRYRPLWSQRKNFINCKIIVEQTLWTLNNCFLDFVIFDKRRKTRPKSFLHWKDCLLFQKVVFSTTSWVLKKCPHNDHSFCQNTSWTLTNCPMRFANFVNTRTKGPYFFPHWKDCLFFKKIVFSTTSQALKKSYNFHSQCQKSCRHIKTVSGELWQLITRWKLSQKLLSQWEQQIFQKFLAIDLLGPREKKLFNWQINVKQTLWTLK